MKNRLNYNGRGDHSRRADTLPEGMLPNPYSGWTSVQLRNKAFELFARFLHDQAPASGLDQAELAFRRGIIYEQMEHIYNEVLQRIDPTHEPSGGENPHTWMKAPGTCSAEEATAQFEKVLVKLFGLGPYNCDFPDSRRIVVELAEDDSLLQVEVGIPIKHMLHGLPKRIAGHLVKSGVSLRTCSLIGPGKKRFYLGGNKSARPVNRVNKFRPSVVVGISLWGVFFR